MERSNLVICILHIFQKTKQTTSRLSSSPNHIPWSEPALHDSVLVPSRRESRMYESCACTSLRKLLPPQHHPAFYKMTPSTPTPIPTSPDPSTPRASHPWAPSNTITRRSPDHTPKRSVRWRGCGRAHEPCARGCGRLQRSRDRCHPRPSCRRKSVSGDQRG